MARLRLTPMRIAVLLGLALAAVRLNGCGPLALFDARTVDVRLRARGPQPPSPEVVIVAVDNESIEALGRWPWPRSRLAELLRTIDAAKPGVIGFDIVQSEPTELPSLGALASRVNPQALSEVATALERFNPEDFALADAIEKSGRVVLGYFFDMSPGAKPGHADETMTTYGAVSAAPGPSGEERLPRALAATTNLPAMTKATKATGYFNTLPDPADGYYRRVPMVVRYHDRMALPLSLAMLSVLYPDRATRLRTDEAGVEAIWLGRQEIPVAENGELLLNYRGPGKTFPHVSAADVLAMRDGKDPKGIAAMLANKIVLVGVTATAVADVRATSFDGVYPGVEIHATALDNILRDDFLTQPKWTVLIEIAAILFSVLVLGAALGRARGVAAAGISLSLVAAYLLLSQWLFVARGVPLGVVYPLIAIAVVYMSISVHHYVTVERERHRTREAFSRYLNPELARLVSENPEMLRLGGTRRCLTVLFSDIRGFTSISEKLEPETLVEILNVYLGEMTQIIFENDGTLDKYIGDAIMAVWGAPIEYENHAALACAAALDMGARLRERREEWTERGWPKVEAGIGLHTGDMVAGNMGSAHHLSYTVMGDNVNLGSRLEGLTKTYGVSLLVSEATVAAAGDGFISRELDLVAVKGKALPVRIYELLGRAADAERWKSLVEGFEAALALFRARRWQEAAAAFAAILEKNPQDGPSRLYVGRCSAFASSPPPDDWAGVTVMETK